MIGSRLSIMMFLQFFIWGSWYVTAAPFVENLAWPEADRQFTVSWIYTVGPIAAIVAPLFLGVIADRFFATQRVLAVMHLLAAIPMLAIPSMVSLDEAAPGLLVTIIAVHMLCYMPTLGLTNTLAFANIVDQAKQFPMIRVFGTVGWIAGNLVVAALMEDFGREVQFYAAGASGVALALFSLALPHTPPPLRGKPANIGAILGVDALSLLRDRSFCTMIVATFLISIPLAAYYAYAATYLEFGVGYTGEEAAQRMPIGQAAEVVFMLAMPWFFARLGVKKMIAIGMLAWIVRYVLFGAAADDQVKWMVLIGIGLHGICYDFLFVTAQIYVDKFAPESIRGQAQGLFVVVTQGLGLGIGAQVMGRLYSETNVDGAQDWSSFWYYPAIGAGVILVLFMLLFRERKAQA